MDDDKKYYFKIGATATVAFLLPLLGQAWDYYHLQHTYSEVNKKEIINKSYTLEERTALSQADSEQLHTILERKMQKR